MFVRSDRFQCLFAVGVAAAALLLVALPLPGQSVENVKLTEYRKTFESELEKLLTPLKEDAIRKLKVLESQRAIRKDYEGAIRARDRRLGIADEGIPPRELETTEENVIRLKMAEGRTAGNTVMLDRRRNAIVGFKRPGHSVSWDIMKLRPGWYKVLAEYGCAEPYVESRTEKEKEAGTTEPNVRKAGGTFRFFEDTSLLTKGSDPVIKTVVPTGGWDRLVKRNIGKLKITGTRATLKLEVVEAENEGIMYLRGIELIPTVAPGEESVALGDGSDAPGKLQTLREKYQKEVASQTREALVAYVADLKNSEEKFVTAEDLDGALAARKERERVEELLRKATERDE